jgi:hypothetical protein
MNAFLDSDLKAILHSGPMSERVIFDPDGEPLELWGIVNRPIVDSTQTEGSGTKQTPLASRQTTVVVRKNDLSVKPKIDDVIEYNGRKYRICRVYSDGQGMVTLGLHYQRGTA